MVMAALLSACAGDAKRHAYVEDYQAELAAAEAEGEIDPAQLPDDARRFYEFLGGFSADVVRNRTEAVYAPDAYLNDTLKTVRGNTAIRDYFVETFSHLESLDAEVVDVARSGKSWYYRWRMTLVFEDLNDGKPTTSVGMSHIVFDDEGRVLIHQDYWDAATHFFRMVPIAGKVIDKVKDRL